MQLCWLVLVAVAAAPSGHAPLRLELDSCPGIDRATVDRVVTMELEAAPADERQEGALTTARAQCEGGRAQLTIEDPVTGKSMTRALDLADQPRGLRSRLLGLAIAELVLASWIELRLSPGPPPSWPEAAAPPEARRTAAFIAERRLLVASPARTPVAWELVAGPAVRRFSSGLFTWGLAAGVRHWLDRHPLAGVGLELDGSYGEASVPALASASALGVSAAPCLLMRGAFGPVTAGAGAGWRVGLAHLSAELTSTLRSGRSAWRAWTGPFLEADLSVPLSRALFLRAGVESGYVLVPARGRVDSASVLELDGAWLGGTIALGAKL